MALLVSSCGGSYKDKLHGAALSEDVFTAGGKYNNPGKHE